MRAGSRIGWTIAVAFTIALVASAGRVERWIGSGHPPRLTFDVGYPADDPRSEPERIAGMLALRLQGRNPQIDPGTGAQLVVTADGGARDVEMLRDLLTRTGELAFFETVNDTPIARTWYEAARAGAYPAGVEGATDSWTNDKNGEVFTDHYLRAPTAELLDAALAQAAPPPPGLRVLHEHVEPASADGERHAEPYWRTYLVVDEPELDGRDIAKANITYDQNTLRPEVIIYFTPDGAERFGDLTERIIGRKLAIVLDGEVNSAPIVQTAIRGGVSTITMGGADERAMEAEATSLVNVLRSGAALPAGMSASLRHAAPGVAGSRWLPRLALAGLAGLATFFLAPLLARRAVVGAAAPVARGTAGAARVALAAAITLGLPIALIVLGPRVELPFTNPHATDAFGALADLLTTPPELHVFALGLTSVLSGFWLAELIAAIVPGWRARRLGTVADRRRIDVLALALALAFAAIQAWFFVRYLDSTTTGRGARLLSDTGGGVLAVVMLTLMAGVAVQMVIADVISRHGLCNGYVALFGVGIAHRLFVAFTTTPRAGVADTRAGVAAAIATIALTTVAASSLRDDSAERRRLPWTGLVPVLALGIAGGLALLLLQAAALPEGHVDATTLELLLDPPTWLAVGFPLAAAAAIVRARGPGALTASRVGLAITAAFVLVLVLARALASQPTFIDAWLLPTVLVVSLVLDGGRALLARLGMRAPVAILAVHDVDRADRAADALAGAGIPASVENLRLRAVARGLAGFAPIVVRVDRADADRAIEAIAAAEAGRDPRLETFAGP